MLRPLVLGPSIALLALTLPACFKGGDEGPLADEGSDSGESADATETESGPETSSEDTQTCPEGSETCPCAAEQTCDAGLACVEGMCVLPVCGNGVVEGSEACDDGNDVDDDACSNACQEAVCGDAIVQQGEECDDGNPVDDDACSNTCVLAVCGDGIIQQGEVCDDGNKVEFDDCNNSCALPSCGDGVLSGLEECDDGNMVADDMCTNECTLPACGDGIVQQGEDCDDGNAMNGDGCTANCTIPPCQGMSLNPGNGIIGCWYTGPVGQSCTQVCQSHGGFNAAATKHTGNGIGKVFWPAKADRGTWQSIECSSVDNNTNWGANGSDPDPNFNHGSCHLNCACTF
jgi:cysteine-rich repeat protein